MGSDIFKTLIDQYIKAYNRFDIDEMLAQLAPDIQFENYSGSQLTIATEGIEAFRELAEQSKLLFSEREQRITGIHFDQQTAVVEIAYRGRLAQDIPNGPPAGTLLELRGTSEFLFDKQKITKIIDRS